MNTGFFDDFTGECILASGLSESQLIKEVVPSISSICDS
jgi:hypothetical protein